MNKKDLGIAALSAAIISLLTIPTINNLPLPEAMVALGTRNVAILLGVLTLGGYVLSQFLGKWIGVFRQIGKFAVVGILNTVLDFAVLNTLISVSGISEGSMASAFKGVSFIIAVVNSYYWNKHWTFSFKGKVEREFLQFLVVSLIGFGINVGVFSFVVNVLGSGGPLWANLGALAGTAVSFTWNFLGYKFIVFKPQGLAKS